WIGPHLFVPVAEETGLISQLGDWVLGEACQVAREWPNLTIAVNLSPIQFCDEGFAERICALVRAAGVSPHQIELEVTEGVVRDQNETVRGSGGFGSTGCSRPCASRSRSSAIRRTWGSASVLRWRPSAAPTAPT
ncbi:MAG: EAL domain-containing protein, partial [Solirubrobacteraceae bacterium]|nr:EAL domain-containing protein [Solirubrobacteraceae bacterium]